MIDPFRRPITYLRLSVTDRCDLRCRYCMAERMTFLPRRDVLTFEETDRLVRVFVAKGVRKLRVTGGEPLVRREIVTLFRMLSRHLGPGGLEELTLTTNGQRLERCAEALAACGVRRVNVSLDSLEPATYARITRGGKLRPALDGIAAAGAAGLAVKVNCVALKHDNLDEIPDMIAWAHGQGHGFTLIEAMPMGDIGSDRFDQYVPLSSVRETLSRRWSLTDLAGRTGGPARYVHVRETGGRLGFITPLSENFCDGCNRVRVTCTGRLYLCLGQDEAVDLREVMRSHPDDAALSAAIDAGIGRKPRGHEFVIDRRGQAPAVVRHMSVTGG